MTDTIFKPGDVFTTRNLGGEDVNTSPGYYNHVGIYTGFNKVVEAQVEPFNKVIVSDLDEFCDRYYHWLLLRHYDLNTAIYAASLAYKSVGVIYSRKASIYRHLRPQANGENCVSLVRRCYKESLGYDPRWHKPDHLANDVGYDRVFWIAHTKG